MKHIRFTQSPTNINETNHQEKYSRINREEDGIRNREEEYRNREKEDRNREEEYRNREEEDINREEEDINRRNREEEKRITKEEKFKFLKDVPVLKYIIIVLIILFVIYICYKLYIHFTKKTYDKQSVIIDDIKIEKNEDSELLDINSDSETESVIDDDDVGRIDDIIIEGTKTGLPIANMRYVYF